MPIFDAKGFPQSRVGQEIDDYTIPALLGAAFAGLPGLATSLGFTAANKYIPGFGKNIAEPLDFVPSLSVIPMAKRHSKLKELLRKTMQGVDVENTPVVRQQVETTEFPFSRGGREGTYFKYQTPYMQSADNYTRFNPELQEGGANKVVTLPEVKNPLILHKEANFGYGNEAPKASTLDRLLGRKEAKSLINSLRESFGKDDGTDYLYQSVTTPEKRDLLARLLAKQTGESINKTKKVAQTALNAKENIDSFIVKDFLMHTLAKRAGYDSIVRNTIGKGDLDYVKLGPGDQSRYTPSGMDEMQYLALQKTIKKLTK